MGYIDADNYRDDVRHVAMFLDGQSRAVIQEMIAKMEDDGGASRLRKRRALSRPHRCAAARKNVSTRSDAGGEADVIALAVGQGAACERDLHPQRP